MKAVLIDRNIEIGSSIGLASSLPARMKGLLGRKSLAQGEGLLIKPCAGIHTFFMKFSIDALFLDRNGKILAVYENLPPSRITPVLRKACSVLELPAGTVETSGARVGDSIIFS